MSSGETDSAARFALGLRELSDYLLHFDEAGLTRAVDAFRIATRLSPANAGYRVALGFALDARGDSDAALAAMRRATELDPEDEETEVFVLTLLAEAGRESEALTAIDDLAKRTGLDIESLGREVADAGMPVDARTLLANGFIHARNFIRSRLDDAIDRAERSNAAAGSQSDTELEDCLERRAELEREIDPGLIPSNLRHLLPWVFRLGVGDDPCRALLIGELTEDESAEALRDFDAHAAAVHAWLDSFGDDSLPTEAAAFMYSLLALEEMKALQLNDRADRV